MKFSFIIPVYNVEKYLRQCLDSVVNQTFQDIEIICVDDGSTDACPAILAEYQQKDSRIQVVTQQNSGTLLARKAGITIAKGDYLLFLDPDDWFDLNAAERLAQVLEKNDVDILQFGLTVEPGKEMPTEQIQDIDAFFNRQVEHLVGSDAILTAGYINEMLPYNQVGKAIRTSIAQKAFSVLPEVHCIYAEDQSFGFVLFSYTQRLLSIPDRMYHYRAGVGISTKNNLTVAEYISTLGAFRVLEALKQFVATHYADSPLHQRILAEIQHSMVRASVELAAERTVGYKDVEEWMTPLCEQAPAPEIALLLARKLEERKKQMAAFEHTTQALRHEADSIKEERTLFKQECNARQQEADSLRLRIRKLRKKRRIERIVWVVIWVVTLLLLFLMITKI